MFTKNDPIWLTVHGEAVPLSQMEDSHIRGLILVCESRISELDAELDQIHMGDITPDVRARADRIRQEAALSHLWIWRFSKELEKRL